jgi:hypothetical protein
MDFLEEKLNDADRRSVDALKLGNHNEQYSRKHNIRMLNFPHVLIFSFSTFPQYCQKYQI